MILNRLLKHYNYFTKTKTPPPLHIGAKTNLHGTTLIAFRHLKSPDIGGEPDYSSQSVKKGAEIAVAAELPPSSAL